MKVWIYVEGESDKFAIEALWKSWVEHLQTAGHGVRVIPLGCKSKFFNKIGHRVAEKLIANKEDIVAGLPDLYPNKPYLGTKFEHIDIEQLKTVEKREVSNALKEIFGVNRTHIQPLVERFFPSALKHDLEMLLLAAREELRSYLRTTEHLGNWRNPIEDQNQERPPKRVIEELFRTKSEAKRAYRDTKDARAILQNVTDIKTVIYDENRHVKCPVFKALIDWIGIKTTIPAYE